MYLNRSRVRTHCIKVYFNDAELQDLLAIVSTTGDEKGVIARELIRRGMADFLAHGGDPSLLNVVPKQGAQPVRDL